MPKARLRSKRKKTGGLYNRLRKKHRADVCSDFIPVKIADTKKRTMRKLGGSYKHRLLQVNRANVIIDDKTQTVGILSVKENAANPNFVRMNVVTKGAIVETDAGLAKVTSRPTQHGLVNAVLVKK
jgi:small subunit ribosomal protein S8e